MGKAKILKAASSDAYHGLIAQRKRRKCLRRIGSARSLKPLAPKKPARSFAGHLLLILAHFWPYSTMDVAKLAVQHARMACFTTQMLSTAATILMSDDAEVRIQTPLVQRLKWTKFVLNYKNRPLFRRHLRMTYTSFSKLLDRIKVLIDVDDNTASKRGGKIIPEIHLYATIRYLAGASYSDICIFCGVSVPSFYCIVRRTIKAINNTLKIEFPSSEEECAVIAEGFERVSHSGVIKNCVGAIDGYLLTISTPRKSDANNVRSYFSGHYQRNGINIQATCDADCRFTFMGIGGPGVTKDRQGVKESGLFAKVQRLPGRFICVCDCAYQATETFVPTFGGDLALRRENDNFNFFLSQLRIRIEMAFGLMTKKWGILQRPLTNSLSSIKHIICCIARLHNYCIDERLGTSTTTSTTNQSTATTTTSTRTTTTTINYSDALPASQLAEMSEAAQTEHREILSEEYAAWSHARDEIVQAVKQLGLKRPVLNRKRKRSMLGSVPEDRFHQDALPA